MLPSPPVFPAPLPVEAKIGVISPSRFVTEESLMRLEAFLKAQGFKVYIHPQNYARLGEGRLAGTHAERAQALMDVFLDPSIDAVLCTRGGSGAIELLDLLDYDALRAHPKPFIGFSDTTLLLHALTSQAGFVTFHGPLGGTLSDKTDARNFNDWLTLLATPSGTRFSLPYPSVDVVRPGTARGVLCGGNLSLLEKLIGTPYQMMGEGQVLFIEEVGEELYKVAGMMKHMALAGKFKNVQAVLFGDMVDIRDDRATGTGTDLSYGLSLREVLLQNLPSDIPVCFNFPCGHATYITTMPIGANVNLALNDSCATLTYEKR